MADPTSRHHEQAESKPDAKRDLPAARPPAESQDSAPQDDIERGDAAYWRERASRLGTTPHHIAGALWDVPAGEVLAEVDVRNRVRDFAGRQDPATVSEEQE